MAKSPIPLWVALGCFFFGQFVARRISQYLGCPPAGCLCMLLIRFGLDIMTLA